MRCNKMKKTNKEHPVTGNLIPGDINLFELTKKIGVKNDNKSLF